MKKIMKRISMKDIASELNLSITTVSFVINGKSEQKGISAATTKKVNDLIEQRGFNPNTAARMLRTGKSKTIGLIVEDIGNYFFANIAKTVEIEAHKNGYSVYFSSTENSDCLSKELINKMKNSSVDGYIITATKGIREELEKLQKENISFVLLDRLVPGIAANFVIVDNYQGAYDLTGHLINNGYSKIGFVSIIGGMSQLCDRERGFQDALAGAAIKMPAKTILKVPFPESDENVKAAINTYLAKNPGLDALFFSTNFLGVLGIDALQQSKLAIPADIAVVCFDDNDLFRLLTPAITVAAQPIKEIASRAFELLIGLINNEQKQDKTIGEIIKPKLIIRDSSSPKKLPLLKLKPNKKQQLVVDIS